MSLVPSELLAQVPDEMALEENGNGHTLPDPDEAEVLDVEATEEAPGEIE